jgi:hypothetical protein
MQRFVLAGVLLVLPVSGCGGSGEDEAAVPSATPAAASPSPTASGSYVSQVNALCESMIPAVMAVRGDSDGDGGGDFPAMDEFEAQEAQLEPILEAFDAAVDAIPVTEADRAAADAFNAFRDLSDSDAAELVSAAKSGDQQKYEELLEPSAEFEAKRSAMEAAGISCPAR